jgi:hypothetical protein
MVFAALLLLSPLPLFGDVVVPVAKAAPIAAVRAANNFASELPAEFLTSGVAAPAVSAEFFAAETPAPQPEASNASAEPPSFQPGAFQPAAAFQPGPTPAAFALQPVKVVRQHSYDSPAQKRSWYALMFAAHAGAAFDAWSTRRALSGNWGTEADPLMRPFAHNGSIYVATQVTPLLMDLIGRRAMVSEHPWVRKFWWVPQSLSATMSFQAATHNVAVVR